MRLGTTTLRSTNAGDVTFVHGHDLLLGAKNSNFAEVGAGTIDWSLIEFKGTPVTVSQSTLHPWCNPRQAEDVNDSGGVTALDVLIIINHINAFEAGPLPIPPPNLAGPPP